MVELVRSGRDPADLAHAFEPSAQAIRNWVAQADRDNGHRSDGLTSSEKEELARLRRENRQLRQERDILAKAAAWFARVCTGDRHDPVRVFQFMSANQASFPIRTMARVFGVSPAGYYAWRRRQPSRRAQVDADLLRRIRTAHAASYSTYGAPRIRAELQAEGITVSRKRVARLMRGAGLAGVRRRKGTVTTRRDTTLAFGGRCREAGVRPSMGSVGDAYDNAMCESFFATLECELLDRRRCRSHAEARIAVFTFKDGTIPADGTPPSAICHRSTTKGDPAPRSERSPNPSTEPGQLHMALNRMLELGRPNSVRLA